MSGGGRAVWRQRLKRDPVAGHGTARGRSNSQAPWRRPPFATDRGACRADPIGRGRQERHYAFGTARTAEGARRRRRHRHHSGGSSSVARSRAKKSAHAAELRCSAVNAGRARRGSKDNSTSIRRGSSSSTRPLPTPRWRAFTVVRPEASDAAPPCPMAIGKPPPSPPLCVTTGRCAHGPRRTDERGGLSRLCRTGARSRVAATRHGDHGQSPAHKVHGVKQAIECAGASLRYLPPYSPDFNPIERASAKLKAPRRRRRRANHPRPLASHRRRPSPLLPTRMRKLSRRRRL